VGVGTAVAWATASGSTAPPQAANKQTITRQYQCFIILFIPHLLLATPANKLKSNYHLPSSIEKQATLVQIMHC
jgi:hypothetical protein